MSTKQVVVLRTKYPDGRGGQQGIRLGKCGAQIAHASMKVFFDRGKVVRGDSVRAPSGGGINFEHEDELFSTPCLVIPLTGDMASWVEGRFTKVVLGVETEEELLAIYEAAKEAGLPTSVIQDMGATEFKGVPTHTTCAIGPADAAAIDALTGPEGRFKCKLL